MNCKSIALALLIFTSPVFAQLSESLLVTEVLWDSGHPAANEFGEGGHINGDWWELVNISDEPIDMTGFQWDDDDALIGNDFTIIPEFIIQPMEAVIFIREDEASVEHPDGFRAAFDIPSNMRILNESFIMGIDTTTLFKHSQSLSQQSTADIDAHLDGLGLDAEEREHAGTFISDAAGWNMEMIHGLTPAEVEAAHERLIELQFVDRVNFGGDSFSGISSGGDELNLYDAEGNLIQSVVLDAATTGVSQAWGFEDGTFNDLGLSEVGEFGAMLSLTDGSEGRLARGDDFNILFDDVGNAVIDEEYVPEFSDLGSPGRIYGLDIVFPEISSTDPSTPVTLASICGQVANGDASADDLAAALTQLGLLAGDADENGAVAFADFLILSSNFGTSPEAGEGATFHSGDFDCDGSVQFADFLILSSNFGSTVSANASSVPEPSSNVLTILGLFVALTIRKRNIRG